MDESTKKLIGDWLRTMIGVAAGAIGIDAVWLNPDLVNGLVSVGLLAISMGLGWIATKFKRTAEVK